MHRLLDFFFDSLFVSHPWIICIEIFVLFCSSQTFYETILFFNSFFSKLVSPGSDFFRIISRTLFPKVRTARTTTVTPVTQSATRSTRSRRTAEARSWLSRWLCCNIVVVDTSLKTNNDIGKYQFSTGNTSSTGGFSSQSC